jgi:hypothetical protein
MAKVGTSKASGTISQQAAVHPWLAADAQGNKQTNKQDVLKISEFSGMNIRYQSVIFAETELPLNMPVSLSMSFSAEAHRAE